jgi:hypothetical protein
MSEFELVQARTIEKGDVIHVGGHTLDVVSVNRGSDKIYIFSYDNQRRQAVELETTPDAGISKQQ